MTVPLVVVFVAPDRPGLVELLSMTIAAHGGNWLDSRLSSLAGQFGGVILAHVPDAGAEPLKRALESLAGYGVQVLIRTAAEEVSRSPHQSLTLELVGQDRPGIVRDVSRILREHTVNIDDLHTEFMSGAMSGEALFKAIAEIRVPAQVPVERLRRALEALANDIMVDIALKEAEE
jgi:glycine cleavage system regulatory protein